MNAAQAIGSMKTRRKRTKHNKARAAVPGDGGQKRAHETCQQNPQTLHSINTCWREPTDAWSGDMTPPEPMHEGVRWGKVAHSMPKPVLSRWAGFMNNCGDTPDTGQYGQERKVSPRANHTVTGPRQRMRQRAGAAYDEQRPDSASHWPGTGAKCVRAARVQ